MTKNETTMWHWEGPVFILQNVNLEQFCKKYSLGVFETKCSCGKIMNVNIPFRAPNRAGLCAERCMCKSGRFGQSNKPFVVSMTNEQINAGESLLGFGDVNGEE